LAAGENEPNDTPETATAIGLNEATTGALNTPGDQDYYVFTAPSAGVVWLTLTHADLGQDTLAWAVSLLNEAGTELVWVYSSRSSASVSTSQIGLPAGTYRALVTRRSAWEYSDAPYQLTAAYEPATAGASAGADWETEFNDTLATANPITVNRAVGGTLHSARDQDYFVFTTHRAGVVSLRFTHANLGRNQVSWEVDLFDATGRELDWEYSYQSSPKVTTSKVGLPAGTYYALVLERSSWEHSGAAYRLTATFTASSRWETEDNDAAAAADALRLARTVTGTLNDASDVDYYRLRVKCPATLAVMLEHAKAASADESWEVTLLNARSRPLASVTSARNVKRVVVTATVKAGTYYVKVARPEAGDPSDVPYKLTAGKAVTVTFDRQGGKNPTARTLPQGATLGALPKAASGSTTSAGWYTKARGGRRVTATTTIKAARRLTLYAHPR
jgi:hypothetical protein